MYVRGLRLRALLLSGVTELPITLSGPLKYFNLVLGARVGPKCMSLRQDQEGLGAQAAYLWEGA